MSTHASSFVQNYSNELFQHVEQADIPSLAPPRYSYLHLKPATKKVTKTVETIETIHFAPLLVPKPSDALILGEGDRTRHYLPYQSYPASSSIRTRQGPNDRFDPKIYPLARARAPSLMGNNFKLPLGQTDAEFYPDPAYLQSLYQLSPPLASASPRPPSRAFQQPTPSRTQPGSPVSPTSSRSKGKARAVSSQESGGRRLHSRKISQGGDPHQPPRKKPKTGGDASPTPRATVTSPPVTSFTANQMPSPGASPVFGPQLDTVSHAYAPHSPPQTGDEDSQPTSLSLGPSLSADLSEEVEVHPPRQNKDIIALDLGSGLELSTLMSLPSLVEHFSSLPNNLQSHVLFNLLRRAPVPVLQLVNSVITPALKRDFISDLPAELAVLVMTFVDGASLCRATRVSKKWHRIVDGDGRIWKRRMMVEHLWVGDGSEQREAVAIETGSRFLSKSELFLKRWTEGVWDPDFDPRLAARPAARKIDTARFAFRSNPDDIFMPPQQDDIALEVDTVAQEGSASRKPFSVPRTLRKPADPQSYYTHPYKIIYRNRFLSRRNWTQKEPRRLAFGGNGNNVVTALQFDRRRIVAASDDHSINVYSMKRLGLIAQLDGHGGGVWALAYIGDVLVSGSTDRTVRIWDLDRNRCTHIFIGHTSTVRCLQIIEPQNINPDPDAPPIWEPPYPLIVTGSRDSTLRVWKLPMSGVDRDFLPDPPSVSPDVPLNGDVAGNPFHLRVLAGHKSAVRALSGAGRIVVSGSYDNTVRVWDILNGECLQVLRGHSEKVYSVVYDGRRLQCASGSMDGTVKLWSTKTGQCLRSLDGHTSLVGLLGLSKNHLVSAAADSTLRVWDSGNGKIKHVLAAHAGAITCFQHDDYKVISGSDGTLKMWDVRTGQYIRDLLVNLTGVWQVGFDERFCVAAVNRGGVSQWDSQSRLFFLSIVCSMGQTVLDFGGTTGTDGMSFEDDDLLFDSPRVQRARAQSDANGSSLPATDIFGYDPRRRPGQSNSHSIQAPTLAPRLLPPASPLQHRTLSGGPRRSAQLQRMTTEELQESFDEEVAEEVVEGMLVVGSREA